jgi:twitching motility protein PilT
MELEDLLQVSVEKKASDLHIIPTMRPQLRINGILHDQKDLPILTPEETQRMVYSMMSEAQQKQFEEELVFEIPLAIPAIGNFRVSVLHQLNGIAAVFRIIPEKVPSFEELQLPTVLRTLLVLSHGLILLSGPAGAGKSTTLAAMIDYINNFRACHIITIEDPIEFTHHPKKSVFNQLQVGRDTPDFASALRASLRQDPNVILIGELRDLETMRLALLAAETGHLVLATLHSSSAPMAVGRFVDVFPPEEKNLVRGMLSETLQAVICQTLVKRNNGGRVAAFEIMLATPAIRHFIRRDMPSHMESTMQTSSDRGMRTLESSLHDLVTSNIVNQSVAATVLATHTSFRDIPEPGEGGKK